MDKKERNENNALAMAMQEVYEDQFDEITNDDDLIEHAMKILTKHHPEFSNDKKEFISKRILEFYTPIEK